MKTPRERLTYSAIIDRPRLTPPDGGRMIVWPIVNVEDWDIVRPMPRQLLPAPTGVAVIPDVPNWAWHEYGMRVGFWRLLAAFERYGVTPTLSINAQVCNSYPRVAGAARDAGWEFMGHGFVQIPTHLVEDEPAMIAGALETIEKFTGKRPVGWLGPGLTETYDSVDHLAQAGVGYVGDWVLDDQPCEIATAHGPVVAMPYSVELNDITMMAVQHHAAEEFCRRVTDAFDRLYAESAERVCVMGVAVHPYLSGVPHRIKYFEQVFEYMRGHEGVRFWTGERILEWYRGARGEQASS